MTTPSKYTTLLRLKRKRTDPPFASTLQVPITPKNLPSNEINNQTNSQENATNVIFVQLTQEENILNTNNIKKRKLTNDNSFVRVVDCHTTEALPQDNMDKKRKVALKITNCQNIDLNKKLKRECKYKPHIILNPFMRLMDTYLQQYHESGPSIVNIIDTYLENFLKSNKECLDLTCSNGLGSILHGAALWNDVETVQRALSLNINVHLKDGDGRTAYQIATLVGNESIKEILYDHDSSVKEDEYVYDIYCLQDDGTMWENSKYISTTQEKQTFNVELIGGRGYYNEFHEFVVQLDDDKIHDDALYDNHEDDKDSNDEGCCVNDYPDEDEDDRYEDDYVEGEGYEKNWNEEEEEIYDKNDYY